MNTRVPFERIINLELDRLEGFRQLRLNKEYLPTLSTEQYKRVHMAYNPFYEYAVAELAEEDTTLAIQHMNELFTYLSTQDMGVRELRDLFKDYVNVLHPANQAIYVELETKLDRAKQEALESAQREQKEQLGIRPGAPPPQLASLKSLAKLLDSNSNASPFSKPFAPEVERLLDAYRMAYLDTPKTQKDLDRLLQHPLYWNKSERVKRRIQDLQTKLT
jgi:hypothetical protein